jgi:two-component system, NarL family, response regulator NreC
VHESLDGSGNSPRPTRTLERLPRALPTPTFGGVRHLNPLHDRATFDAGRVGRIRVVLANDHAGLRRCLRSLLEHENDLEVVGEAGDFETALHDVLTHDPEVLVLDLRMPDGFSAPRIRLVRTLSPATKIVVTTMSANDALAHEALRAGAVGFVLADSADRELVDAVRRAAGGLGYTSPQLRRAVA